MEGIDSINIHGIVKNVCNGLRQASHLVPDMEQEAYVGAMRAAKSWKPDGEASLPNWIKMKTRWHLMDLIEQAARDMNYERAYYERQQSRGPWRCGSPFESTRSARHEPDVIDRIMKIKRSLPNRQRDAIDMQFWQGLKQDEIAEAMGLATNYVRRLMHLAYDSIREELKKGA